MNGRNTGQGSYGRGIGRTHTQIAGCPNGALFIWPHQGSITYPKEIAARLGLKLDIQPLDFLAQSRWWAGRRWCMIVMDHECFRHMKDAHWEGYRYISSRIHLEGQVSGTAGWTINEKEDRMVILHTELAKMFYQLRMETPIGEGQKVLAVTIRRVAECLLQNTASFNQNDLEVWMALTVSAPPLASESGAHANGIGVGGNTPGANSV